ncbi:MAG: hypothetical protein AAFR74_01595 [Pseudomonadota bacterium]
MEPTSTFFSTAARWAGRYADTVMARENLHLVPSHISKAAAKRVSQGIRAIEAYLRRLLLLLALAIEPGLKPDNRARPVYAATRAKRATERPGFTFQMFQKEGIDFALSPKFDALRERPRRSFSGPKQVPARPLIERLRALRTLLEAPQARAQRLAWAIARRRPGLMLAPGTGEEVRNRHGTEFSATYTIMGLSILEQSRARPPPLAPKPKCPPRIRVL